MTAPLDNPRKRNMRKGPGTDPVCKWAYWEFPFPETYNKVLRVVDVQGVGRLWRLGDVNAVRMATDPHREQSVKKFGVFQPGLDEDKLEVWEWRRLDAGWVLGPFSPITDLFHVYLEDDLYAVKFVSTRAFLLCFGNGLAKENFATFKPPHGTGLLNRYWGKFPERRKMISERRRTICTRVASLLDSLPPEWRLLADGLALEEEKSTRRDDAPRSIHLFNSARYEAEFVGATKTSGAGVVC